MEVEGGTEYTGMAFLSCYQAYHIPTTREPRPDPLDDSFDFQKSLLAVGVPSKPHTGPQTTSLAR